MRLTEAEYLVLVERMAKNRRRPEDLPQPPPPETAGLSIHPPPGTAEADYRECAMAGRPVSTMEAKLNKTERAYLAWARTLNPWKIYIQSWTFLLGWDDRYTPDFIIWDSQGYRAIDTKAAYWNKRGKKTYLAKEDSVEKIKRFATDHPGIPTFIAWQDPPGVWQHKLIKP